MAKIMEIMSEKKSNIVVGNHNEVKIEDPMTRLLFYEREIYFLKQNIELKDKEIEARDRDIDLFKKND